MKLRRSIPLGHAALNHPLFIARHARSSVPYCRRCFNGCSCSEDGSVVITGLQPGTGGAQQAPEVYNYGAKWPMLAVKLDPHYARRYRTSRSLVSLAPKLLCPTKYCSRYFKWPLEMEAPFASVTRSIPDTWCSTGRTRRSLLAGRRVSCC